MDKIDKIKDKLRLDDMNHQEKKELFGKFVDGGGEVINNRQRRRSMAIDRDQQKKNLAKIETHKNSSTSSKKKKNTSNTSKRYPATLSEKTGLSFHQSFMLRLKLKFGKVAQFNGLYFNNKFLSQFNGKYAPALIEIQTIYLNLFKKNPSNAKRLLQRLDKDNLLFFELIEKISNIYEKMTIDQITDAHNNMPDILHKLSELKEPLMKIFRNLYILAGYENTTFSAFEKAFEINSRLTNDVDSYNIKSVKKALYLLFHSLYPKLFHLFCYYEGELFDDIDPEIDEILQISFAEKMGNRTSANDPVRNDISYETNQKNDSIKNSGDAKNSEKETTQREKPAAVKKGLTLMYKLDMKELRKKYDPKGQFENISNSNKTLLTYLLFKEFDREYSFILTTNKIKFNKEDQIMNKVDYKDKLLKLYDNMRNIVALLTQYSEVAKNYEKIRTERPSGRNQYVQYVKRLEETKNKMVTIDRESRSKVRGFMYNVSSSMSELMKDLNDKQHIISNPQDVLTFSNQIDGKMKLNEKKIFEAIVFVYYFAIAFTDRLSMGGDLYGKNLDQDITESESSVDENKAKETATIDDDLEDHDDSIDFSEDDLDKPLLDELDDFL